MQSSTLFLFVIAGFAFFLVNRNGGEGEADTESTLKASISQKNRELNELRVEVQEANKKQIRSAANEDALKQAKIDPAGISRLLESKLQPVDKLKVTLDSVLAQQQQSKDILTQVLTLSQAQKPAAG